MSIIRFPDRGRFEQEALERDRRERMKTGNTMRSIGEVTEGIMRKLEAQREREKEGH